MRRCRTSRPLLAGQHPFLPLPLPLPLLLLGALASLLVRTAAAGPLASPKRGLVYAGDPQWPQDDYVWVRPPSDLTWYYNYAATPLAAYANLSQSDFEFVPMLFGAPADANDTTFLSTVRALVRDRGVNVSHVLTFNEPDGSAATGGSQVDPSLAARVWVRNVEPLRAMGIRVGLPACTGGWGGLPWMRQFLANCSRLVSPPGGPAQNCSYDFVTLHWYGNFEGLASHIGEWYGAFPNATFWVTEYALNDQDLEATQSFYNTSAEYLDRLAYVERYAYFGAFRSSVSNVGPNPAMLSAGGQLTDIGAWYLGRQATGVKPSSKKSGAGRRSADALAVAAAAAAALWMCA